MTTTVSGMYDTFSAAQRAVQDLEAAGIPHDDISIVANRHGHVETTESGTGAGTGAAIGTAVGGGAGLLAGLGLLAIPGVGPVVAAGWLVSTVAGAVIGAGAGAVSGGIIGAMTSSGVTEDDAHVYAEGVRRGGAFVSARVTDAQAPTAEKIIQRHSPVDPAVRGRAYREGGWTTFDEAAPPYTAEEIESERARYLRDHVA
jgi:hypothetical protein